MFKVSSLTNLADNLALGLHSSGCKDSKSCLEYIKIKGKLLLFKCLKCNKYF